MKLRQRILPCFLSLVLSCSALPTAFAQGFSDMPNDWSTEALQNAVANGLLSGADGKIMPDANLTRGEMAAIMTRAFGAEEKADISGYSDVPEDAWYADSIAKAVGMEILSGSFGAMYPTNAITRQEAFAVLARGFSLQAEDTDVLDEFADGESVADWAKDSTSAMIEAGYVSGEDGNLNPTDNITRKEFAALMDRMVSEYISESGTVTMVSSGNIMVNTPDVVLKDLTVAGNLIIGDGVGDGDITLDNVTVENDILVRGGGENTFRFLNGASVEGEIRVNKQSGAEQVRFLGDGSISLPEVNVLGASHGIILQDVVVESVNVVADEVPVTLSGATVQKIAVASSNVVLDMINSVIEELTSSGSGTKVNVDADTSVSSAVVSGDDNNIQGEGTVSALETSGANTNIGTVGTAVTATEDATGTTANGAEIEPNTSATTTTDGVKDVTTNTGSSSSGSSSSGGSSSGGSTTPSLSAGEILLNNIQTEILSRALTTSYLDDEFQGAAYGEEKLDVSYWVQIDLKLKPIIDEILGEMGDGAVTLTNYGAQTTSYLIQLTYSDSSAVDEDITISFNLPIEQMDEYTVSFDLGELSNQKFENQIIVKGETVTEPSVTSVTEYSFQGWYMGGVQFDFATPITTKTELVAKWVQVSDSKVIASLDVTDYENLVATALQYDTMFKGVSPGQSVTADNIFGMFGITTPTSLYALDSSDKSIMSDTDVRQEVSITGWTCTHQSLVEDVDSPYQICYTLTATLGEEPPTGFTWFNSTAPEVTLIVYVEKAIEITGLTDAYSAYGYITAYTNIQFTNGTPALTAENLYDAIKKSDGDTLPTTLRGVTAVGNVAGIPVTWSAQKVNNGSGYELVATATGNEPLGYVWGSEPVTFVYSISVADPAYIYELIAPTLKNTTLSSAIATTDSTTAVDLAAAIFEELNEEVPTTLTGNATGIGNFNDGNDYAVPVEWTAVANVRSDGEISGYTLTATATEEPAGCELNGSVTCTVEVTVTQDALTGIMITGLELPTFSKSYISYDDGEKIGFDNPVLTDDQLTELKRHIYSYVETVSLPTELTVTVANGASTTLPVEWSATYTKPTTSSSAYYILTATGTGTAPDGYAWEKTPIVSQQFYVNETKEYAVTLDWNDGTGKTTNVDTVGRLVTVPNEVAKDGYLLMGWYSDADTTTNVNLEEKITATTTLYAKWLAADTETKTATSVDLSAYTGLSLTAAKAWELDSDSTSDEIWSVLKMTAPDSLIVTNNDKALVSDETLVTVGVSSWTVACNQTDGNWEKGGTIDLTITFNDTFSDISYTWEDGSPTDIKITITVEPSVVLTTWAGMNYNGGNGLTAEQGATVWAEFEKVAANNETSDESVLTTFFGFFGRTPITELSAASDTGAYKPIPVTLALQHTPADATTQESYTLVVSFDDSKTSDVPDGYTVSDKIGEATQVFPVADIEASYTLNVLETDRDAWGSELSSTYVFYNMEEANQGAVGMTLPLLPTSTTTNDVETIVYDIPLSVSDSATMYDYQTIRHENGSEFGAAGVWYPITLDDLYSIDDKADGSLAGWKWGSSVSGAAEISSKSISDLQYVNYGEMAVYCNGQVHCALDLSDIMALGGTITRYLVSADGNTAIQLNFNMTASNPTVKPVALLVGDSTVYFLDDQANSGYDAMGNTVYLAMVNGEAVDEPLIHSDYTFVGWDTDANGAGVVKVGDTINITEPTLYYAIVVEGTPVADASAMSLSAEEVPDYAILGDEESDETDEEETEDTPEDADVVVKEDEDTDAVVKEDESEDADEAVKEDESEDADEAVVE